MNRRRAAQLLVLAKQPVAGRVKTRLCPPCTLHEAAGIAASALADTLDAVRGAPVARRVLALDTTPPSVDVVGLDEVLLQRGGSLGERIANAFVDTSRHRPDLPVLQIGMDTPQAGARLLTHCVDRLLSGVDAVLGMAEDGGWWALGLRDARHAALVRDVPMSTVDTGGLTLRALRSAGLCTAALPPLRDVDTFPDALAVARTVPGSRFAGSVLGV